MVFAWIEKAKEDEQAFTSILGTGKPEKSKETLKDEISKHTTKTRSIKVGASDPGKQRDSFGFVGIKYVSSQILIVSAKRWLGNMYLSVEEKIARIHRENHYDFQVVEINNTGIHVWEVLKYVKNLPIIGVNTSKNLNIDPRKRFDPFKFPTMDKNDMARWLHVENEMGNLVFPRNPSKEMQELQNQISNIIEYKSEGTGSVSYRAEGQEHDDLYMALMLACWYVRKNLMKLSVSGSPVVAGGQYYKEDDYMTSEERMIDNVLNRFGRSGITITDVKVTMPGED